VAQHTHAEFVAMSAVNSGIKDIKMVVEAARDRLRMYSKRTILFLDEIHRYNKSQQDVFLPFVEDGTVTLIGATTENPSFEVNGALLSRCQVFVLKALEPESLVKIIDAALLRLATQVRLTQPAKEVLVEASHGDARYMLNLLEDVLTVFPAETAIEAEAVASLISKKSLAYDKAAEHHYNIISAFIKSMRGSDPQATLYYMARMLDAGEDPRFVIRRMMIFASEDIGNANPQALVVATATLTAFDALGADQGWIPMAQCATFLASSPKSNASYVAYQRALADVKQFGELDVPLHLRNAPTRLMKNLGYGKDYKYAHDYEGNKVEQTHLPQPIADHVYYQPTQNGYEQKLKEWLDKKAAHS
jgi:putative ATPase